MSIYIIFGFCKKKFRFFFKTCFWSML
jgi:hypothetical protein